MYRTLVILITSLLASCGAEKLSPTDEQIQATLNYIKTENSEVILDAVYNAGGVYNWVVSVRTDGTSRKGLARAICNDLYSTGILTQENKSTTIDHGLRVVDAERFAATGGNFREASLGSADCKTFQMFDM